MDNKEKDKMVDFNKYTAAKVKENEVNRKEFLVLKEQKICIARRQDKKVTFLLRYRQIY